MLTNMQDLIKESRFRKRDGMTERQISRAVGVWPDAELDPFCAWTDKASYLEWVVQWKATYRALTDQARGGDPTIYSEWLGSEYVNGKLVEKLHRYPIYGHNLRWLAHLLLALRAYGKRKSWAQRAAARAA